MESSELWRELGGAGGKPGENLVQECQAGGKSTHVRCVRGSVRTRGPVLWPQASKQQGDTGRDEAGWTAGSKMTQNLMNFLRDFERFPKNYGKLLKCIKED